MNPLEKHVREMISLHSERAGIEIEARLCVVKTPTMKRSMEWQRVTGKTTVDTSHSALKFAAFMHILHKTDGFTMTAHTKSILTRKSVIYDSERLGRQYVNKRTKHRDRHHLCTAELKPKLSKADFIAPRCASFDIRIACSREQVIDLDACSHRVDDGETVAKERFSFVSRDHPLWRVDATIVRSNDGVELQIELEFIRSRHGLTDLILAQCGAQFLSLIDILDRVGIVMKKLQRTQM